MFGSFFVHFTPTRPSKDRRPRAGTDARAPTFRRAPSAFGASLLRRRRSLFLSPIRENDLPVPGLVVSLFSCLQIPTERFENTSALVMTPVRQSKTPRAIFPVTREKQGAFRFAEPCRRRGYRFERGCAIRRGMPNDHHKADGAAHASEKVAVYDIGEDEAGMRLDRWLHRRFPDLPQSHLMKIVRKGEVR